MTVDIVRAWKDPEYRKSLTSEELASLPANPAGDPELTATDLENISGGMIPPPRETDIPCPQASSVDPTHCPVCFPEPSGPIIAKL
jgi:mersacidin/lichenicidin family type 2 lantibiotic